MKVGKAYPLRVLADRRVFCGKPRCRGQVGTVMILNNPPRRCFVLLDGWHQNRETAIWEADARFLADRHERRPKFEHLTTVDGEVLAADGGPWRVKVRPQHIPAEGDLVRCPQPRCGTSVVPWPNTVPPRDGGSGPVVVYGVLDLDDGSESPRLYGQTSFPPASAVVVGFAPAGKIPVLLAGDVHFYEPAERVSPDAVEFVAVPPGGGLTAFQLLSFSPDGRYMAVTTAGAVTVWELELRQPIGASLGQTPAPEGQGAVAFTPDNRLVVSNDGSMTLWGLDVGLWAEKVCLAAGLNLTEAEWAEKPKT